MTDHTTPEDTAVSHAEEPQPPIPAEGAPHAYVAVKRTHSVSADRPEWGWDAAVVPVHDTDGDTGTRAILAPATTEPALRMVEGGLYRNPLGAELRAVRPVLRSLAGYQVLAAGIWIARDVDTLFGTTEYLVTADGMTACGYTLVAEVVPDASVDAELTAMHAGFMDFLTSGEDDSDGE